jgi:biotin--protein ligase
MSTQALVYADQGVCGPSASALKKQLKALLDPSISVVKVNGEYLRTKAWEEKTIVLVMGGGSCRYWDEELQAEGVEKIERYVKEGGKYIGICAGAYFASAKSCFNLKGKLIEKSRPLAFFPGKAVGPLVDEDDYLSLKAARAAEVCFKIRGLAEEGALYYQGGCLFDVEEDSAAVEIMSTYRDFGKAAAVFCKVGKGCAFLDGTHPEFVWRLNLAKGNDKVFSELVGKLSVQEVFRQRVWKEIGAKLALTTDVNI